MMPKVKLFSNSSSKCRYFLDDFKSSRLSSPYILIFFLFKSSMRSGALAAMEAEPDLSTFENKSGLAEDMKFLASMPELCDVTFLVGDTREPVCAVKAVLAARSRFVDYFGPSNL